MSLIVKEGGTGKSYTPHPEGTYAAVCCDVQDLGYEESVYSGETKVQYKLRLVFFCGEWTELKEVDGEMKRFPMTVAKKFTASLHEKSALRPFAKSWRGADFSEDELDGGFDFERMVGAPAFIQVGHFDWQGATYAGIDSIMRLPQGQEAPAIPAEYTRLKDRDDWEGPAPHPAEVRAAEAGVDEPVAAPAGDGWDDSDLPF